MLIKAKHPNNMMVFFLAGMQGILLSLALILSSFKKQYANIFLGLLISVFSLELLNTWAMNLKYHHQVNALPFWLFGSYWIIPAALAGFLQANFFADIKSPKIYFFIFTPAFIEILTELLFFYLNKFMLHPINLLGISFWFLFTEILPIIFTVIVLVYYGIVFGKPGLKTNGVLKHSTKYKLYFFYGVFSLLTIFWILESLFQVDMYSITSTCICIFLFLLGYIVYFQPDFFQTSSFPQTKKTIDLFQNYDEQLELNRLKKLFEQGKIYQKSRLTLEDVAQELNLPTRFVSMLINKHQNTNFSGFVNAYRVNEVINRLKDPKESHKTLLAIALDAGFNSKSSFNQIFKTFTGETPSQYFQKIKK